MGKSKNLKENKDIPIKKGDRGAVYVRLSKDDERHDKKSQSIENQIKNAKIWFKENECVIAEIYEDRFISGSEKNRPGLNRLLEDARKGKFDFIWIKDYSRLSRDDMFSLQIYDEMTDLNIRLFSYLQPDMGRRMFFFNAGMNDEEVRTQAKKSMNEQIRLLKTGEKLVHKPIRGYRVKRRKGYNTGEWIIDKKESERILNIFHDFVYNDLTLKELRKRYKIQKIERILKNRKYRGYFDYNGQEFYFEKLPKFISEDLFNKAQEKLKKKSSTKSKKDFYNEIVTRAKVD